MRRLERCMSFAPFPIPRLWVGFLYERNNSTGRCGALRDCDACAGRDEGSSGNGLPRNYQALMQACAREAGAWMTSKYDILNPQAIKRLAAAGAELRPFPSL